MKIRSSDQSCKNFQSCEKQQFWSSEIWSSDNIPPTWSKWIWMKPLDNLINKNIFRDSILIQKILQQLSNWILSKYPKIKIILQRYEDDWLYFLAWSAGKVLFQIDCNELLNFGNNLLTSRFAKKYAKIDKAYKINILGFRLMVNKIICV